MDPEYITFDIVFWCANCNTKVKIKDQTTSAIVLKTENLQNLFNNLTCERALVEGCHNCKETVGGMLMRQISVISETFTVTMGKSTVPPKIIKFSLMNSKGHCEDKHYTLNVNSKNCLYVYNYVEAPDEDVISEEFAHRSSTPPLNIKLYTNQQFETPSDKLQHVKTFLKPCNSLWSTIFPVINDENFGRETENGSIYIMLKENIEELVKPTGWLSSNTLAAISCLVQQLNDRCVEATGHHHATETFNYPYLFCDPDMLANKSPSILCNTKEKTNKESRISKWRSRKFKKIFFPTNFESSHWVLIEVDVESRQIRIYDSLRYDKALKYWEESTQVTHIKTFLNKLYQNENCANDYSVVDLSKQIPHQYNGYDCGVFVAQLMCCLACDVPLNELSSIYTGVSMAELRIHFYYAIKNGYFLIKPYN